jgi:hypothetical protein
VISCVHVWFVQFWAFFLSATCRSRGSVASRLWFFSPAPRHADVGRPNSFCSPGPPERSKIVNFDLPDQPSNLRSEEQSPMQPSLLRPQSPRSHFVPSRDESAQEVDMDHRDGDGGDNIGREDTNARRAGRREWGERCLILLRWHQNEPSFAPTWVPLIRRRFRAGPD